MKKIIAVFLLFAGMMVYVVAVSVQAGGPCNGCWWNDVDKECCENGVMCCGWCGPGDPNQ